MKSLISVGIVSTIKSAHDLIYDYVNYHLSIGFSKIILFLDDPEESYPQLEESDQVTIIKTDSTLKERWKKLSNYNTFKKFIETDILARQALNVGVAIELSKDFKIDWLLHIDCDELFYCPQGTVLQHFEQLKKSNCSVVNYSNYEAISESVYVDNVFQTVTVFKKNPLDFNKHQTAQLDKIVEQYPEKRAIQFLAYKNGKAVGLVKDIRSGGAHFYKSKGRVYGKGKIRLKIIKRPYFPFFSMNYVHPFTRDSSSPVILHYTNCGFQSFYNKYKNVHQGFPDTFFGNTKIEDAVPFHIQSRNFVKSNNENDILDFYVEKVQIQPSIIQKMIDNDLAVKIDQPARLLKKYNEIIKMKAV